MKKIYDEDLKERFREEMRGGYPEILDPGWKDVFMAMAKVMTDIIDEMPEADDGRKVGQWERMQSPFGGKYWKCSVCDTDYQINKWSYCPYCGAKMVSDND